MKQNRPYNGVEYILDEKSQTVKLLENYHNKLLNNKPLNGGFKKFGGSSIGDIFETDSFKSQFGAFCHMARLKMPVLQKKYVNAGVILEPKIFEVVKQQVPNAKHIEADKVYYDYFPNKEIIGGVPDGIIPDWKRVLEFKTVNIKKYDFWTLDKKNNIPLDYRKQAQLYTYLLGYDAYTIVALFLEDKDYDDPKNVDVSKRKIESFNYKINIDEAKDDEKKIIDFYKKYSVTGISPQYYLNKSSDRDQVEYLKCHNENEWKTLFEKWKKQNKIDKDLDFEKVK